jgi:hypothetical protein
MMKASRILIPLVFAGLACAQQPRGAALWEYTPDPKLPNVLIIGDSISMGYTPPLRTLLEGKANVMHPMRPDGKLPANCFSTAVGLTDLNKWLGSTKWSVIQFNWGLHDLCYRNPEANTPAHRDKQHGKIEVPLEAYKKNLEALVNELQKTGARLIWASTTKVPDGDEGRFTGDDVKYNAAARGVMERHHIAIDDLHALTVSFPPELSLGPGNVHYKPEGYARLAKQVADSILAALAR